MAEFIRKHGVTVCPPTGSKELIEHHTAREKEFAERIKRSWGWGSGTPRRARKRGQR